MAYRCLDCGYQAARKFPAGRCPACDSFNIKSTQPVDDEAKPRREKEPKTLIELVLMVGLWALLLYGAWDKYLRDWLN